MKRFSILDLKTASPLSKISTVNKILMAVFGIVVTFLVAYLLNPKQQGLFYLFQSLISIQVLGDLGVTYSITQLISRALGAQINPFSKENNRRVLGAGFLAFVYRWFWKSSIFMLIILAPLGIYWIHSGGVDADVKSMRTYTHWLLISIFSTLILPANAILAFFEGYQQAYKVYLIRIVVTVVIQSVLIFAIFWGLGSSALVFSSSTGFLTSWLLILIVFRSNLKALIPLMKLEKKRVTWEKDIKSFVAPIAVSWISGFFVFQTFVPLAYRFHGAVAAGIVGMTFQIASAVNGISVVWVLSKSSIYSSLHAQGKIQERNKIFLNDLRVSIILIVSCIISMLIILVFLINIKSDIVTKVASVREIIVFLIPGMIANHIINCQGILLRSSGVDYMYRISMLSALAMAIFSSIFIYYFSVSGALAAYAIVLCFITLPYAMKTFSLNINS